MENNKAWRKSTYINIQEPVKCMLHVSKTVVIWSKSFITGYNFELNKVVWKIQIEDFPHASQDPRMIARNGIAVFYISAKPNTKFLFAVDPDTGKIIWVYNDGPFRNYTLIPTKSDNPFVPVYNFRNDTFVEGHYILLLNKENGQKMHETKLSHRMYQGFMADNALFITGLMSQFQMINTMSSDKSVVDLGKYSVYSSFCSNGNMYFLLKDERKTPFIMLFNLATNQTTFIEWPVKNSMPECRWNILENYIGDSTKLLITWAPASDCKDHSENTRFGLFDATTGQFIWKEAFTCRHHFIPTPYGFFSGSLFRNYEEGSVINQSFNPDFTSPKSMYCMNDAIFYYNWERIEIYVWSENNVEVKKADATGTKIYNFKELVKY